MSDPILDFLGPKGILMKKGLAFRREQLEMAESVRDAIAAGRPLLIEAGTGVGKSLAYLLPAALAAVEHDQRILVSTHTKALQEQLVKKDLPFLSAAMIEAKTPFSFALFMGSENYLCMRRFHQAMRDSNALFTAESQVEALRSMKAFTVTHPVKTGQSGLRMDLPDVPDEVWRNILRESDNCMSSKSPYYDACYHHMALDRMRAANLLVVNHALFFSNLAAGGRILPKYDVVVLDEAHSIEEVAASHLGLSLTNFSLNWQLDRIHHPETQKGLILRFTSIGSVWRRTADEQVKNIRRLAAMFFQDILDALGVKDRGAAIRVRKPNIVPNLLSHALEELAEHLRAGRDRLESPEDKQEMKAYADRLTGTAAELEKFLTQEDRMMVYWIETERRMRGLHVQLRASPIDLSKALRTTLFSDEGPTAILTSATLTVGDEFDFISSRIGASGVTGITLGSPFEYERQCLLYLPERMPDPAEEEAYYLAVEDEIRSLIQAAGGGVFVLCTSYDWLHRLYRDLSAKLADYKFFRQGGPRSYGLLDEFRKTDRAVLIGTDTFWQGVDVPGEALRLVIVTRLPFALPSHPLEEARMDYLRAQGIDPFTHHTLPSAVLMLRQGFGRLIRRQEDRGVVAILDPRIKTRQYGHTFLKSLPAAKRTSRQTDVKRFFMKS